MKNIMQIDSTNNCICALISNINDATNKLQLEIIADISKNPKIEIDNTYVSITSNSFIYEIDSNLYIGTGILKFRVIDDDHIGEYFQIQKVANIDGNLYLKKTSNFVYALSIIKESESTKTTVSVKVGNTTTLPAGQEANVSNSGDDQNIVLNFSIPQGEKGEKGDIGATGPQPSLVNNLTSTSTTEALTACQGKVLNDKIANLAGVKIKTLTKTVTINKGFVNVATKRDLGISSTDNVLFIGGVVYYNKNIHALNNNCLNTAGVYSISDSLQLLYINGYFTISASVSWGSCKVNLIAIVV